MIITRHGARFPLKRFEHNTSWPDHKKFWEVYGGKLTPTGQQQLWLLGQKLQQRYSGVWDLDHPAFPQKCHIYSSNSDRTLGSAQAFLNGMFPSLMQTFMVADTVREPKEWVTRASERRDTCMVHQGLDINIASLESTYQPILHGMKNSPRYDQLKDKVFEECTWFSEHIEQPEYQKVLAKLQEMTGFNKISKGGVKALTHFQSIAQQIGIERAHRMAPILANEAGIVLDATDEALVREAADTVCRLRYQGNSHQEQRELSRLASGLLPAEVLYGMAGRVNGTSERCFSLYSAHDNTIMAFLSHMGFRDWNIPQFGGYISFELHRDRHTGEHTVKMLYNDRPELHDPLTFDEYIRLPPGEEIVQWKDVERGDMGWDEFFNKLMHQRQSFSSVQEWTEAGELDDQSRLQSMIEAEEKALAKMEKKLAELSELEVKKDEINARLTVLRNQAAVELGYPEFTRTEAL